MHLTRVELPSMVHRFVIPVARRVEVTGDFVSVEVRPIAVLEFTGSVIRDREITVKIVSITPRILGRGRQSSQLHVVERVSLRTHVTHLCLRTSGAPVLTLLLFNKVYLYVFKCHTNYCKYRESTCIYIYIYIIYININILCT